MATPGITFTHPNAAIGSLQVRLPPTQVDYEYNLNTNIVQTHAGEVVQLLSVNFNKLVIEGRFGIEGPHGVTITKSGPLVERPSSRFYSVNKGAHPQQPYAIGLSQMTEYFRTYFLLAGQGGLETVNQNLIRHNHDQQPMTVHYQSDLEEPLRRWTGYPTSFPSYKRSNEDFAPAWHIEFEVEEADQITYDSVMPKALQRLRAVVGYQAFNPFSDPIGAFLENKKGTAVDPKKALKFAKTQAEKVATQQFDELGAILSTSLTDIQDLIQQAASRPVTTPNDPKDSAPDKPKTSNKQGAKNTTGIKSSDGTSTTSTSKFKIGQHVTFTLQGYKGSGVIENLNTGQALPIGVKATDGHSYALDPSQITSVS